MWNDRPPCRLNMRMALPHAWALHVRHSRSKRDAASRRRHSCVNSKSASGMKDSQVLDACALRASLRVVAKSTNGMLTSWPGVHSSRG